MENKNEKRDETRRLSKVAERVHRSLQNCRLAENRALLTRYIDRYKADSDHCKNLQCVRHILDILLADVYDAVGCRSTLSYMEFEEAIEIYLVFTGRYSSRHVYIKDKDLKSRVKDLLLHEQFGLRVYLVKDSDSGKRFIVLRPDHVDLTMFLSKITEPAEQSSIISKSLVRKLLDCMETEWDRKVLRVLLSMTRSYSEFSSLGMDSHNIAADKKRVMSFAEDFTEITKEAKNSVMKNLESKRDKLKSRLSQKRRTLMKKQNKWTTSQVGEMQEQIEDILSSIEGCTQIINGGKPSSMSLLVKRMAKKLMKLKRLRNRNLGSGRKHLIDEDDERYLASCIADKASAHGRRKDAVLYVTGRRNKTSDWLGIINYHHKLRNLPMIKSKTAIYNRSRPKNKRSLQAKHHKFLGLWCCKKPPKNKDVDNMLTHYCRAAKKNVVRKMCEDAAELTLYRSYDDKAYLCPSTSTGMMSCRTQKVVQCSDSTKAPQFFKYDFPKTMVNVTPGSILYMRKGVKDYGTAEEQIQTLEQDCVVVVKPKYFVGSGASVWSSHVLENRHKELIVHEVPSQSTPQSTSFPSYNLRKACLILKDYCTSFNIQTLEDDICRMGSGESMFRDYEIEKLEFLKRGLGDALHCLSTESGELQVGLSNHATGIVDMCDAALVNVSSSTVTGMDCLGDLLSIKDASNKVLEFIGAVALPMVSPRVVDLTDAGPGVSIKEKVVQYRLSQEVMICDHDYYTRIHLAPGDSSQNEVERLQSCVGDAICDGGYLEWEYKKKFSDVDLTSPDLTSQQLEDSEYSRMKFNAFKVADEVAERIDGAPYPDGYLKAYVTHERNLLFFWDTIFLEKYLNTSSPTPGCTFYSALEKFWNGHFVGGEKIVEYVRDGCLDASDKLCGFCKTHRWRGPPVSCIPTPIPNYNSEKFKYCHISNTPNRKEKDDYNPRVQLKAFFEDEYFDQEESEAVDAFSKKFIVDANVVRSSLNELRASKISKVVRSKEKKEKKRVLNDTKYEDIKWEEMVNNNTLKKQIHDTLNKYLNYHKLIHFKKLLKPQKVEAILTHYYQNKSVTCADDSSAATDSDDDSDDDEVTNCTSFDKTYSGDSNEDSGSASDEESVPVDNESDDDGGAMDMDDQWEDVSLFTTTKYGRNAGNWRLSIDYRL